MLASQTWHAAHLLSGVSREKQRFQACRTVVKKPQGHASGMIFEAQTARLSTLHHQRDLQRSRKAQLSMLSLRSVQGRDADLATCYRLWPRCSAPQAFGMPCSLTSAAYVGGAAGQVCQPPLGPSIAAEQCFAPWKAGNNRVGSGWLPQGKAEDRTCLIALVLAA